MKLNVLNAKIERNQFKKFAGVHFVDESSKVINTLKKEGKNPLVGIQKSDDTYTILGEKNIFYSSYNGNKGSMALSAFCDALSDNALKKGKMFSNYTFIRINNEKVWLKNKSTMESFWNTLLWLENLASD